MRWSHCVPVLAAVVSSLLWALPASAQENHPITVTLVGNRPLRIEFIQRGSGCETKESALDMQPGRLYSFEVCHTSDRTSGLEPMLTWRLPWVGQIPRPKKLTCASTGGRPTRCWVFDSIDQWRDGLMVPVLMRGTPDTSPRWGGTTVELSEGTPSRACPSREWSIQFPMAGDSIATMLCYQRSSWDAETNNGPLMARDPRTRDWKVINCCFASYPHDIKTGLGAGPEQISRSEARDRRQHEGRYGQNTPAAPVAPPPPRPNQSPPANQTGCLVGIGDVLRDKCGPLGTNHYVWNRGPNTVTGQVLKRCTSGTNNQPDQNVSFRVAGGQKQVVGCSQYDTYPFPTYCSYWLVSCN